MSHPQGMRRACYILYLYCDIEDRRAGAGSHVSLEESRRFREAPSPSYPTEIKMRLG
jgi:hypothetical protein